ncbi:virulence RhuM family protein [Tenacibaculum piscium]|uniref:virulence RhuM family protein n=1 Tax=Tenacibaculum piscium TaxID=1458515 RepID=UPI001F36D69D|nr:virulence RhuM family protein [Tenacibaculum piscium]
MSNLDEQKNFIFYTSESGATSIQVSIDEDTVWMNEKAIAEVFGTSRQNINYHINNIFLEGELSKSSVCKEVLHTRKLGNNTFQQSTAYFNLDAIISIGYRVNSVEATRFRVWATKALKEYLIKGFVLDDDRLKQGKNLFDKDYFDELIERIREIRASERRFYQKITDIYATAIDYDTASPITKTFFATVQNKLEFAITKHTAPELIKLRASSEKPNMGLTSWKNEKKGGKILKTDVRVAKNYLEKEEITELNRIVTMYLDYAENQAEKGRKMSMKDWVDKLDAFLVFNEYNILKDAGKVKTIVAKKFAEEEYKKFRILQDNEYESDFDKLVSKTKKGKISE